MIRFLEPKLGEGSERGGRGGGKGREDEKKRLGKVLKVNVTEGEAAVHISKAIKFDLT